MSVLELVTTEKDVEELLNVLSREMVICIVWMQYVDVEMDEHTTQLHESANKMPRVMYLKQFKKGSIHARWFPAILAEMW